MTQRQERHYDPDKKGSYKPDEGASDLFAYVNPTGSFSNKKSYRDGIRFRAFGRSFDGGGGPILTAIAIALSMSFDDEFADEFDT